MARRSKHQDEIDALNKQLELQRKVISDLAIPGRAALAVSLQINVPEEDNSLRLATRIQVDLYRADSPHGGYVIERYYSPQDVCTMVRVEYFDDAWRDAREGSVPAIRRGYNELFERRARWLHGGP